MRNDRKQGTVISTRHDHYQDVTDRIVAALEADVVPWRREWNSSKCGGPLNAVTRHAYRGINRLLLDLRQMGQFGDDPRWCSYRQAQARGWQVRRGESGTRIYFYRRIELDHSSADREPTSGNPDARKVIPLLRAYVVFHASQIEGIPEYVPPDVDALPWRKPEGVQTILDASGVEIRIGDNQPCYRRHDDIILLPPEHAFESAPAWAATAVHELAHSSGHPSRLNRDLSARFESASYAAEEVIVEWASCMVCSTLGIAVDYANSAGYIDSWLDKWLATMRADKRAIFRAATEAQRIADFLFALHPDFAAPEAEEAPDQENADGGSSSAGAA